MPNFEVLVLDLDPLKPFAVLPGVFQPLLQLVEHSSLKPLALLRPSTPGERLKALVHPRSQCGLRCGLLRCVYLFAMSVLYYGLT